MDSQDSWGDGDNHLAARTSARVSVACSAMGYTPQNYSLQCLSTLAMILVTERKDEHTRVIVSLSVTVDQMTYSNSSAVVCANETLIQDILRGGVVHIPINIAAHCTQLPL